MKKLSELTPEEKRIIVAEFDGWKRSPEYDWTTHRKHAAWKNEMGFLYDTETLPDYLNDLNAIVKACRKLSMGQLVAFEKHLNRQELKHGNYGYVERVVNATASQRTDALVLTLGKAVL